VKYQVTDKDLETLKFLLMRGTEENLLLKLFFQHCFKEWTDTLDVIEVENEPN
jgi:hypothetical protein